MESKDRRPAAMKRDGWELLPSDPTMDPLILACVEAREAFLDQALESATNRIGINGDSERPYRSAAQIAKSAVRGLFRTDPRSRSLAIASARRLSDHFGDPQATFYAAPPYAYIHLTEDDLARNEMHRDDYDKLASQFFVSWTPLNDCGHGPIEIVPGTHGTRPTRRILWSLHFHGLSTRVVPRPTVSPRPRLGESLAWSARTYHSGTANQSAETHLALNTKIRDRLIPLEPCHPLSAARPPAPTTIADAAEHTDALLELIEGLDSITAVDSPGAGLPSIRVVSNVIDSTDPDPHARARLSFSLTMAGMRMPNEDPAAPTWNLAATLLSPEYLWSFRRLLDWAQLVDPEECERYARAVFDRYPSRQVLETILEAGAAQFNQIAIEELPVADWT